MEGCVNVMLNNWGITEKQSHERTKKKGEETSQSDQQCNGIHRYEIFNRENLSKCNENIKGRIDNKNDVKSDQSPFSLDIVAGIVINKDYDNTKNKYVRDKSITNSGINLEKEWMISTWRRNKWYQLEEECC